MLVDILCDGKVVNTIIVNSPEELSALGITEWQPAGATRAETTEEIIAKYEAALDEHLDTVARQYRYRDREMFALRSGYPGPYQVEGAAFGTWMDTCNKQAYDLMASVVKGEAELPSISEFIDGFAKFIKPE